MAKRNLWIPLTVMSLLMPVSSLAQMISVQGTGTVDIEAEFANLSASVIVDAQNRGTGTVLC